MEYGLLIMIVVGGDIIALKYVIIDFVWGFACFRDVMQTMLLGVRLEWGKGTVTDGEAMVDQWLGRRCLGAILWEDARETTGVSIN